MLKSSGNIARKVNVKHYSNAAVLENGEEMAQTRDEAQADPNAQSLQVGLAGEPPAGMAPPSETSLDESGIISLARKLLGHSLNATARALQEVEQNTSLAAGSTAETQAMMGALEETDQAEKDQEEAGAYFSECVTAKSEVACW